MVERFMMEELMVFVGLMATLGCLTKIILTVVHRRRPTLSDGKVDELVLRLARMEQAIDATAVEVERISEAQRFTTKLLVERGHPAVASESPRRVITPH
jgi:hypothetical protein